MALIQCPNCGSQISDKAKKCIHCGTPLKNKRKNLLVMLIAICFVFIIGMLIFVVGKEIKKSNYQKMINNSKESFIKAQSYESDYDYAGAIDCYAKVVKEDVDNYEIASEKIQELEKAVNKISDVQNAINAIYDAFPETQDKKVEEAYCCMDENNYLIIDDEIHIKFAHDENNDFYTVTQKEVSEFSDYFKSIFDEYDYSCKKSDSGYTVVQWKVQEDDKGLFTSTIISLRNDTIGYAYKTLKEIDFCLPGELFYN